MFLLIGLQVRWILRDVQDERRTPLRGGHAVPVHVRRGDRAPARVGVPGPVRAGPARPGQGDRTAPVVAAHHRARLGRDARRGDAGGRVRDPRGVRLPRDADPHRAVRGGRDAVRPGLDAAVAGPPAQAARPRPARGRAGPGGAVREGVRRRPGDRLELHHDDEDPFNTVQTLRDRASQRNTAAWERLGGTSPDEETPSESYARLRLEMLDAERAKVLHVRSTGSIPHEVVEDVLADARRGGVHARHPHGPPRGAPRGRRDRQRHRGHDRARASTSRRRRATPRSRVEGECEDCVRDGFTQWVHLRKCLACGHMACCDSSPRRHASAALRGDPAPGDALRGARRGLALVLRRQPTGLTGPG